MWFPMNENVSSSWPPKFTFQTGIKSPRSPRPSPDAMEGIIASELQSPRSGHVRSATRAIPNRISRSNSLSVPATPTNLWRQVSAPKGQDWTALSSRGLVGAEKCSHPPPRSGRIRPSPPVDMEAEANPSKHDATARCSTPPPPVLPPTVPSQPSLLAMHAKQSVSSQWDQNEPSFLRLWGAQKHNPYLPLVFSPFNPLRTLMPPLFWKSISTTNRPFAKVQWNFQKPLPSPALRTRLRSRK